MGSKERSQYQQGVVQRYYENMDTIMLQRLGELVTELYLAEAAAKKKRLWERANAAMTKLKVPASIIEHIMSKKDVEVLAKNLQDWLVHAKKK